MADFATRMCARADRLQAENARLTRQQADLRDYLIEWVRAGNIVLWDEGEPEAELDWCDQVDRWLRSELGHG